MKPFILKILTFWMIYLNNIWLLMASYKSVKLTGCEVKFHTKPELLVKNYHCNVHQLKNNINTIDGYFELSRNITELRMNPVIYMTRGNNARITLLDVELDACLFYNGLLKNAIGMVSLVSKEILKVSNVRCPMLMTNNPFYMRNFTVKPHQLPQFAPKATYVLNTRFFIDNWNQLDVQVTMVAK